MAIQHGYCIRFNLSNIEFSGEEREAEDFVKLDVRSGYGATYQGRVQNWSRRAK